MAVQGDFIEQLLSGGLRLALNERLQIDQVSDYDTGSTGGSQADAYVGFLHSFSVLVQNPILLLGGQPFIRVVDELKRFGSSRRRANKNEFFSGLSTIQIVEQNETVYVCALHTVQRKLRLSIRRIPAC